MSDWSPPPRAGHTRTGKSLKAVRRYYAMKEAAKRKRSPETRDDEDRNRHEQQHSAVSKRKRSPDDDKLSKRIAAELKVQQEANEKRTRQTTQTSFANQATDRSALPQFAPREIGPTFQNENNPDAMKSPKSAKSNKSVKSTKSVGTYNQLPSEIATNGYSPNRTSIGCVLTCFILGTVYIVTWIFMLSVNGYRNLSPNAALYSSIKSIGWLAIGSLLVIVSVPYWVLCRQKFKHALVTLALMVVSTTNLTIYLIFTLAIEEKPNDKLQEQVFTRNSLNLWLAVSYLLCHFVADGVMIRHTLSLVSKQIGSKQMSDTQMSQYLAPK